MREGMVRRGTKGGAEMSEELKRCPFCGGQAVLHKAAIESFMLGRTIFQEQISCVTCGVKTEVFDNEEKAVKAWNRRADDD